MGKVLYLEGADLPSCSMPVGRPLWSELPEHCLHKARYQVGEYLFCTRHAPRSVRGLGDSRMVITPPDAGPDDRFIAYCGGCRTRHDLCHCRCPDDELVPLHVTRVVVVGGV